MFSTARYGIWGVSRLDGGIWSGGDRVLISLVGVCGDVVVTLKSFKWSVVIFGGVVVVNLGLYVVRKEHVSPVTILEYGARSTELNGRAS